MQLADDTAPPWLREAVQLKDELPLRELAAHLGVPVSRLTSELRRRGVARLARQVQPGQGSQGDAPARSERHAGRRAGSKDSQIEQSYHLLGKVPDSEVARLAGVSVRTLASYRARNGIPGYVGPRRRPPPRGRRESKVDDFAPLLGRVPDRVVADIAGMSLGAVRNFRIKKDIPAAGRLPAGEIARIVERYRTRGAADPEAHPPSAPHASARGAATVRAWRCAGEAGRESFIVLAGSLTEAAERAAAVLGDEGMVSAIEHLGVVLGTEASGAP